MLLTPGKLRKAGEGGNGRRALCREVRGCSPRKAEQRRRVGISLGNTKSSRADLLGGERAHCRRRMREKIRRNYQRETLPAGQSKKRRFLDSQSGNENRKLGDFAGVRRALAASGNRKPHSRSDGMAVRGLSPRQQSVVALSPQLFQGKGHFAT